MSAPGEKEAAAAAPAAEPAAEAAAAPAAPEPVQQPEPAAAEAAPPEAKGAPEPAKDPTPHIDEPSLLELAGEKKDDGKPKPDEAKPEEKKPGDDKAAAEKEAAKPEPVQFEPYTIPEGFQADQVRIGEFNTVLGNTELTPQQRGQALIDMHLAELKRVGEEMVKAQYTAFSETRQQWRRDMEADSEIGGKGMQTALAAAARMRDLLVAPEHMKEFQAFARHCGAGDNPAFIRILNNMARWMDEPAARPSAFNPPPDIGQKPNGKGSRDFAGTMYNHPASEAARAKKGA